MRERATQTLKWVTEAGWLLDMSLDHLSLGRAAWQEAAAEAEPDFTIAQTELDVAVAGLRQAGRHDYLPRGLLARAALLRSRRKFDEAWHDLGEAEEIAERGEMRLFLADCALEAARLHLAEGKTEAARERWKLGKGLVEEMSYHRRDQEVAELENELKASASK